MNSLIPLFSAQAANDAVDFLTPIKRVLDSHWYILGGEVAAFEREFAEYCGIAECVTVANGTDALEIGINPLVHYIMCGAARGLETYPASRSSSHDLENIEDKALELEKHSPSPEPKRAPKWGRWRVIKSLLSFLKSTVSNSLPAAACGADRN